MFIQPWEKNTLLALFLLVCLNHLLKDNITRLFKNLYFFSRIKDIFLCFVINKQGLSSHNFTLGCTLDKKDPWLSKDTLGDDCRFLYSPGIRKSGRTAWQYMLSGSNKKVNGQIREECT